ncbi:MAG: restriction endonuclease subunit S [Phaeodactylibacter sp.]|nr:restriction endonuclease subunit S [Phaeodactylibacter sp.]
MKWTKKSLGQISEKIDYGYTASAGNSGVKFLRITDIQNGIVNWETVPQVECSKIEKYALAGGDIVFARTGATTGKSFLIEECPENAVFASYLIRVRPNKAEVFSKYLSYFFDTPNYWGQISSSATGATLPGVNSTKLKELQIPLPPLPTQRRIAAILDKADALRRKGRELLDKYDELVQAVFLELFGDPVKNEKQWDILEFKDVIESIDSGWSPKCEDFPKTDDKDWAVLKLGAVTYRIYNPNENKALKKETGEKPEIEVRKGDLLFSRKNTYELVGACAYVFDTPSRLMLPDTIFRLNYVKGRVSPIFLWQLINDLNFRQEIQRLASGSSGSMPNISKGRLLKKSLPIPPPHIQNHFAEIVKNIEAQKAKVRQQITQSEALFQSLLQRAFRGELVH